MTALEAKRATDNFNLDLYKRTLEKVTGYTNKRIEEAAYRGSYEFYLKSDDELLITAIGEREVLELFRNVDLREELEKQFKASGFLVSFEKVYEKIYITVSWREPC